MGLASCIFIIPLKVSRELAKVRPGHHLDLCWDPQTPAVSCFQCQVTFPGYLFQQILQWVKKLWLLFFFFFFVQKSSCKCLGGRLSVSGIGSIRTHSFSKSFPRAQGLSEDKSHHSAMLGTVQMAKRESTRWPPCLWMSRGQGHSVLG